MQLYLFFPVMWFRLFCWKSKKNLL
jgi:hypothetical protein